MTTQHGSGEQFSKHSAEFHKKASDLGHDVKDLGGIGGKLAADTAHIAEERLSEYYEEGMKKAKHLEGKLETEIRENPIRSMMIAAGIGLVLGAIWRRR